MSDETFPASFGFLSSIHLVKSPWEELGKGPWKVICVSPAARRYAARCLAEFCPKSVGSKVSTSSDKTAAIVTSTLILLAAAAVVHNSLILPGGSTVFCFAFQIFPSYLPPLYT